MNKSHLALALRVLARRKFFTAVSLFGISLTLVVIMTAVALLDHEIGAYPPEVKGDRTLHISLVRMKGPNAQSTGPAGYKLLDRTVRGLPGAETASIYRMQERVSGYAGGRKIQSWLKRADGEFWKILEFEFVEGGPYTEDDERAGRRVAVINEQTRASWFSASPAVGRTVSYGGDDYRVVGVVRNVSFSRLVPFADVWTPISAMRTSTWRDEIRGSFCALILARDRAAFGAIRDEFDARIAAFPLPDPRQWNRIFAHAQTPLERLSVVFFPGDEMEGRPGTLVILFASGLVLFMMLPAINLVNLNVSRILERAGEIGVRRAFGATPRHLLAQFLLENVVLCTVGGAIGFAASWLTLAGIEWSGLIPYAEFRFSARLLGWSLLATLFFGVLSGAWPALRMSRLHPVEALRRGRA